MTPASGLDQASLPPPSYHRTLATSLHLDNLDGAYLESTHLEGAALGRIHLRRAGLTATHLEGATLGLAHLEGAALWGAHLEGALLAGASFDKTSTLNDAVFTDVRFDQVIFENTNLTVVDWSLVDRLGDEHKARRPTDANGKRKARSTRLEDFKATVRANRVLAVALQAQGLSEDASRFAYRAQVLQRQVLRRQGVRKRPSYVGSLLLAAVAGYGYRLWRIVLAYALLLTLFAGAYYVAGQIVNTPLAVPDAFLISFTAIHGRVFLGQFGLHSALSWIAGVEAVAGIVIEGVFVAMLIQRFFGR